MINQQIGHNRQTAYIINSHPLISIIIPVYNAARTINVAIESVLNQTYDHWQLILVNDGSTDDSGSICRAFEKKDRRIRYIEKSNTGVTMARRTGCEMATGEWIFFLDADDYIDSNCLLYLLRQQIDNDMVCGNVVHITRDGKLLRRWSNDYEQMDPSRVLSDLFDFRFPGSICAKLVRTEIIRKVKWPDSRIRIGEDTLTTVSILSHCRKVTAVNIDVYLYIDNSSSVMRTMDSTSMHSMQLYLDSLDKWTKDFNAPLRQQAVRFILCEYYAYLMYGGNFQLDFIITLSNELRSYLPIPLKVRILFVSYRRSNRIGRLVRKLFRTLSKIKNRICHHG